jgi:hypothetical protein
LLQQHANLFPSFAYFFTTAAMSSLTCEIVHKQTKDVLPTLSHNGQKCIVTEAGTEFEVKVRLENRTGQDHKASSKLLVDHE